jgi:hypothetical protein
MLCWRKQGVVIEISYFMYSFHERGRGMRWALNCSIALYLSLLPFYLSFNVLHVFGHLNISVV